MLMGGREGGLGLGLGRGGGGTQSINIGNDCGTSRTFSVLGISPLPKLAYMYMYIPSLHVLIIQKCLLQEVGNVVQIMPSIVLGRILHGNFLLQLIYSIQIKSLQPSRKMSYLIHHF